MNIGKKCRGLLNRPGQQRSVWRNSVTLFSTQENPHLLMLQNNFLCELTLALNMHARFARFYIYVVGAELTIIGLLIHV